MNMYEKRIRLHELMNEPECTPLMGAHDVLSAKMIESMGFPVVYTGSFITGAAQFGLADVGLVTLNDLLGLAREIAKETTIPLVCDCDTGWYHAANIWRTVHEFEAAGASAIQIEDTVIGKHVTSDPVELDTRVMYERVRAACDAREDKNFMILARTDHLWLTGDIDGTIDRVNAYLDAGADAGFITFPASVKGLKEWRHRIKGPLVTTPIKYEDSIAEETEAGANMSVYWPNTIYAEFKAVQSVLQKFHDTKDITKVASEFAFDEGEFLKVMNMKRYYDNMEKYHVEDQYKK